MKSFMEQYGMIMVVGFIVLALISVAMFFRGSGTNSITNFLNEFMERSSIQ